MGVRAVFLVGFMASGKTSVGQELARRLAWDFVDLDSLIESRHRSTISAIFRDRGEAHFRAAETATLRELTSNLERNSVVALGGGAFIQEQNRRLIQDWPSVFLEAPPEELWTRCDEDPAERPLRKNREQFLRLYEQRLPFYRKATATVQTSGRDLLAICSEIETTLHLVASPPQNRRSSYSPTQSPTGESR